MRFPRIRARLAKAIGIEPVAITTVDQGWPGGELTVFADGPNGHQVMASGRFDRDHDTDAVVRRLVELVNGGGS